jgi:hypothetical protein
VVEVKLTTVAVVAAGLLAVSALAGAEDVYRWVDKSGEVIYSQVPPDGAEGEWIKVKAPPPVEKQKVEDVSKQTEEKANPALDDELRKEYCEGGRQNLKVLEEAEPGQSFVTADKRLVTFSPEELEEKIKEAKAVIKAYCDDE